MSNGARPTTQLLDLLLIGLTWAEDVAGGKKHSWAGNSIFQVMRKLEVISEGQCRYLADGKDRAFHAALVPVSHLVWPGRRRPSKVDPAKLLIVTINTPMFFSENIVMPRGYKLVATPSGKERARLQVASFGPALNFEAFAAGWNSRTRQMGGMNARDKTNA